MSQEENATQVDLEEIEEKSVRPPKELVCTSKSLMSRFDVAPFEMCITQNALDAIRDTIGTLPPETGGKLFGPIDRMGIDLFEFDEQGSSDAGAAIYAPNTKWGTARRDHHIMHGEPLRLWWGDIHSHPGGSNTPSGESGRGLGDMGYARQVFEQNEAIQWFFMPIVNHDQDRVYISPYIISRDNPTKPLIAPALTVCEVDDFPEAEFPVRFQLSTIAQKFDEIASDIPDNGPDLSVAEDLAQVGEQIAALQAQITRSQQPGGSAATKTIQAGATKADLGISQRTLKDISTIAQLQYVQTGILGALALMAVTASIVAIWPHQEPVANETAAVVPAQAAVEEPPVIEAATPPPPVAPSSEGYHHEAYGHGQRP